MNFQIVFITVGVIASVFLGALSNWIYDLLRNKGIFPDRASIKAIIIIILASLPLIVLIVLSEISEQEKIILLDFAQIPIPIWLVSLVTVTIFAVGYFLGKRRVHKLENILEVTERRLSSTEQKLETTEEILGQYLKSSRRSSRETIIRPK